MKIAAVSDLHAYKDGAEENSGYKKLNDFLNNSKVKNCDVVVFLGDVFDLLVGNYDEHINVYENFFVFLKNFTGVIFFLEGNHDFLCSQLFSKYENVHYYSSDIILEDYGKKILFSHGDGPDLSQFTYRLTKVVLNNSFIGKFIQEFIDYDLISKIGNSLSRSSRERNKQKYTLPENNLDLKNKYIAYAEKKFMEGIDIIVLGHNHILECYTNPQKKYYLNNGFAQESGFYTYIEDGIPSLLPIS